MKLATKPRGIHLLNGSDHIPVKKAIQTIYEDIVRVVNGRVYLGDPLSQSKGKLGNVDGVWPGAANTSTGYTIQTPAAPNTEFQVNHNLGRIPTGYDVKSQDAAGIIYDSRRTSWNKSVMYLKCNVASMNIVLFVH